MAINIKVNLSSGFNSEKITNGLKAIYNDTNTIVGESWIYKNNGYSEIVNKIEGRFNRISTIVDRLDSGRAIGNRDVRTVYNESSRLLQDAKRLLGNSAVNTEGMRENIRELEFSNNYLRTNAPFISSKRPAGRTIERYTPRYIQAQESALQQSLSRGNMIPTWSQTPIGSSVNRIISDIRYQNSPPVWNSDFQRMSAWLSGSPYYSPPLLTYNPQVVNSYNPANYPRIGAINSYMPNYTNNPFIPAIPPPSGYTPPGYGSGGRAIIPYGQNSAGVYTPVSGSEWLRDSAPYSGMGGTSNLNAFGRLRQNLGRGLGGLMEHESSALFAGSVGLHFASSLLLTPLKGKLQRDLDPARKFQVASILAGNAMGLGQGTVGQNHLSYFQKRIKEMSLPYSFTPVDVMTGARELAQSGFSGKDILGLMPSALKFSELTGGEVNIVQSTEMARMLSRKFRIGTDEKSMNRALSQVYMAAQVSSLSLPEMRTAINSLSASPLEFPSSQLPEYLTTVGMMRNMGQLPAQAAATTAGFLRSISRFGAVENQADQRVQLQQIFAEMGIKRRTRPNYRMFAQFQYLGQDFTDQLSVNEGNLGEYSKYGKKVGDIVPLPEMISKLAGRFVYKRDVKGNVVRDGSGNPIPLSDLERSSVMTQLGMSSQVKNIMFGYQQMQTGKGAVWNENLGSWVQEGKILARGFNDMLKEIINSSKSLDIGFKNMAGTLNQAEQRLGSSLQTFSTTMGEVLLPAKVNSTNMKLGIVNKLNSWAMSSPASASVVSGGIEGLSKGVGVSQKVVGIAGGALMALAMTKTLFSRNPTLEEIVESQSGASPLNRGSIIYNQGALKAGYTTLNAMGGVLRGTGTFYSSYALNSLIGEEHPMAKGIGSGIVSGGLQFAGIQTLMNKKSFRGISSGKLGGAMLLASLIPDASNFLKAQEFNKRISTRDSYYTGKSRQELDEVARRYYATASSQNKEIMANSIGINKADLDNMIKKGSDGSFSEAYSEIRGNFANTILSKSLVDNFESIMTSGSPFASMLSTGNRTMKDLKPVLTGNFLSPEATRLFEEFGNGSVIAGANQFIPGLEVVKITDKASLKKYTGELNQAQKNTMFPGNRSFIGSLVEPVMYGTAAGAGMGAYFAGVGALPGAGIGAGVGVVKGTIDYFSQPKLPKVVYGVSKTGQGKFVNGNDIEVSSASLAAIQKLDPTYLAQLQYQDKTFEVALNSADSLAAINDNLISFMKALMGGGGSGKNQVTVNQIFKSADREMLKQQAYQMGDLVMKRIESMSKTSFKDMKLVGGM